MQKIKKNKKKQYLNIERLENFQNQSQKSTDIGSTKFIK